MSGLRSPSKGGFLESITLYRKVPKDLTDATNLGGVLSLACAATMAYLFVSNILTYMEVETVTDVALDNNADTHMKLFFNITMERLPCNFASVDLFDAMGTSLTNISADILKYKVTAGLGERSEFYIEHPHAVKHEQLEDHEVEYFRKLPDTLPMLHSDNFQQFAEAADLVLVAFGAPWCPWSQRLEPIWAKTYAELKREPHANAVRMARVDCTDAQAQQLCQRQHIHAFPTLRVYRHKLLHSHENYLGDRTSKAFLEFIKESLPHVRASAGAPTEVAGQRVDTHTLDGEGCQLVGSVRVSRVPGNLRISAVSAEHSFNTRIMNVSHHVDKLFFSSPRVRATNAPPTPPSPARPRRSCSRRSCSRRSCSLAAARPRRRHPAGLASQPMDLLPCPRWPSRPQETTRLRHALPLEQRSGLMSSSYRMHAELATLKHCALARMPPPPPHASARAHARPRCRAAAGPGADSMAGARESGRVACCVRASIECMNGMWGAGMRRTQI